MLSLFVMMFSYCDEQLRDKTMRYFEKKDFTKFCDKADSFAQVLAEKEQDRISALHTNNSYSNEMKQGILNYRSKQIGRIFIKGVLTKYWATEEGAIILEDKTRQAYGVKTDRKRHVRSFTCYTPFNKEATTPIALIMAKTFLLPEGDSIKAYTIRFKDGKWWNCKLSNIEIVKRGSMGAAKKKAVKVMQNGKFYAVFESVSLCSNHLQIPRRRMSEMLTTGKQVNGFTIERFS